MGQAALDLVIATASEKPVHGTIYAKKADSVAAQIMLAEAALKFETARLHTFGIIDRLYGLTPEESLSYAERAHMRAQVGYAAQQILETIDDLVNINGAGSFDEASHLQQIWRDANTAARHAGLNAKVGAEIYGKSLLAIEERISQMV